MVYPAFHVMAGFAELSEAQLLSVESNGAGRIAAIAARKGAGTTIWVANLTSETQTVRIRGTQTDAHIALLDEDSFETAAQSIDPWKGRTRRMQQGPILLKAYAVARVDTE